MNGGGDRWLGQRLAELTPAQVLARKAAQHGDRVFLRYLPDGRTISCRDLDLHSNRVANGLARLGVGAGTHVALMMDNSPEMLLTLFALGKLGAVAIPLNTGNRGAPLRYLLNHSDATVLIADADLLGRFEELRGEVDAIRQVVVLRDASTAADASAPPTEPRAPGAPASPPTRTDWAGLLTAPDTPPDATVRFRDLAYILYTSGTTGPAKGVMLSHAQCFLWGLSHARAFGHRDTDIVYVCLPLFHVNALQGATYNALMVDSTLVLQRRFSASSFWDDIRRHRVTITNLLGSMVNFLWSRPPRDDDADNDLRMCMSAPIPSFGREFERRFGLRFIQSYSLTDFGPTHAYTLVDPPDKLGACGRVRAGVQARIVDDDDLELPAGERGELIVRHDMPWTHSMGYYKMPQASADAWRNGWFHTGDRGYVDADGYFWFLDRVKDAIRRRGENISAFEVEQVLLTHPQIREAAVFAVGSEMSEDEVAAAIVPKEPGTLDERTIVEFCARSMARFMVPRFVLLLDDLPRNASQKVEKTRLKQLADQDRSRLWDREAAGIVLAR